MDSHNGTHVNQEGTRNGRVRNRSSSKVLVGAMDMANAPHKARFVQATRFLRVWHSDHPMTFPELPFDSRRCLCHVDTFLVLHAQPTCQ